ncbi:MAG: twin-arginine translocation signal domain-containing protein [Acidobacteriota bacterium]|jgi:epoxyqueuosine reductase
MVQLNRRGFLKTSAQSAAAAGLAGIAGVRLSEATAIDDALENDTAARIESWVKDYTATSPRNSIRNSENEKAWEEPLVGFSGGGDPIFKQYKEYAGPFHWTPLEIFQLTYPNQSVKEEDLTVISWILPHTEAIKADLRKRTKEPSEKWIRARLYGEQFNEELRKYLADNLTQAGHPAVVPILSQNFKMERSGPYGMASTWSERHAAYASGLGTFGLCDGLITAKGKAIRCGSVVAKIKVPATPRPYKDHHAYCLYYAKGICGMCAERCAGDAISKENAHDKNACMRQCMTTMRYATELGLEGGYGCGFCQTGVPCESQNPVQA